MKLKLHAGFAAAAAAFAMASTASFAVDGVILIDQNKALAGNVTAGDTAGYPVTINTPGSYRLSGNLTVPAGKHGIVFAADGITLDLNGFSISGPSGEYGLTDDSVGRSRIAIRNGHVNGFSDSVRMIASTHLVVENMTLSPEGAAIAVVVGAFSRVQRNTVVGNGLIQATCPSILTENISNGFVTSFVTDAAKQCIRYHNRSLNYGGTISE
ncbi:MAG: hypothetical protein IPJ52_12160 [Rhodocyclaceae bacterium]|nr:hypothetical protein [Rhodocyclaceae bacterium]